MTHRKWRFPPSLALALLAGAGCCSSRETVTVHGETRVLSETEERLVVSISSGENGSFLLRAWKERDRVLEQDYWRSFATSAKSPAPTRVANSGHGAPYGKPAPPCPDEVAGAAIGQMLGESLAGVFELIRQAARDMTSIFRDHTPIEPWPPRDLVTVRLRMTVRKTCIRVVLAKEDGSGALALNVRPGGGFMLGAERVGELGGIGTRVLVCDGEVATTITLETSR